MKAILFTIAWALLSVSCYAQSKKTPARAVQAKPIDVYYGFRGFRLDSPLSAHPELKSAGADSSSGEQIYRLPAENLKVGKTDLQSIDYIYYKHRLKAVLITVSGGLNRHFLLETFKQKYGPETYATEDYADKYLWEGKKASILFGGANLEDETVVLLISKAVQARQKTDAADDL